MTSFNRASNIKFKKCLPFLANKPVTHNFKKNSKKSLYSLKNGEEYETFDFVNPLYLKKWSGFALYGVVSKICQISIQFGTPWVYVFTWVYLQRTQRQISLLLQVL